MHDPHHPVHTGALPGARRPSPLALLLFAATLAACGKDKVKDPPPREPLTWNGLAIGMPVAQAKERLQALGTQVTCQEARTVMFLDAGTLTTQWVKADARGRTLRCDAVKAGAKPKPTEPQRGLLRAKLFFLDGTLRQLNVILAGEDENLASTLKKRWGPPEQASVSIKLYNAKKGGSIRLFRFKNQAQQVLWLRRASMSELIFLAHLPEAVASLQQIASPTKDP